MFPQMTGSPPIPDFADIEAAATRIKPWAVETPLIENADLNALMGGRVLLKPEMFQRTGSFKFRGACNRILQIPEADRKRGVVAFSSGNHAQGVAAVAALFGVPATIVMPADAPKTKIEGTRSYGAEIVTYDRHTGDREAIAAEIAAKRGAILVKPFDDPDIVAGQATIGLELAKQAANLGADIDVAFVPCGGGGLVSGIALALAHVAPATRTVAVEPEAYDGMRRSRDKGERSAAPAKTPTLADSLMAPMPGATPFALAQMHLAGAITVNDSDLARAVSYAFRRLKLVVEPGGGAGLGAVLRDAAQVRGQTIAVVLSGGNCDPETTADCCARFSAP
jgi:threonine dehydratase